MFIFKSPKPYNTESSQTGRSDLVEKNDLATIEFPDILIPAKPWEESQGIGSAAVKVNLIGH